MERHLYLSPHLDDAVLSCGGLISRQVRAGETVTVLTLFAGDPPPAMHTAFAARLARGWANEAAYVAARQAEDREAVELLGAAIVHWPYPDCIYRQHPGGGALYVDSAGIFGEIHPYERAAFVGELAVRLQALVDGLRPAVVYVPLGAGHHVDHYLTQWAARRLTLRGARLRFYEDYPYSERPALLEWALSLGHWRSELELMDVAALEAKIAALSCYRTQVAGLFDGEEAMPQRVKAYAHGVAADGPAERFWQPEAT